MKRIIICCLMLFIFGILSNGVLAQEWEVYEDENIVMNYPVEWDVYEFPESEEHKIMFTAPGWTEEEGGTIIAYSLVSFPGSYDSLTENNKNEYVSGFTEPFKEMYDKVTVDSSKIISVGEFDALKIDITLEIEDIIFKQIAVIIFDGDRYHLLTYGAKSYEYEDSVNLFDEAVNSFKIKEPHEIPVGYVNLADQKTFLYASFVILLLITIFGIYRLIKTKDNKKPQTKNVESYKNIAKKANIAMWIGIIGDWFLGIGILFYLFLISIFVLLICSILLIDTTERKYAKSNLFFVIFLLIAFVVGYFIGFVS